MIRFHFDFFPRWSLFRLASSCLSSTVRPLLVGRGVIVGLHARRERGGDGAEVADSLSCVVCLGAEREVILLPCGHVCVCADCADILITAGHTCPVCRASIDTVLPAYVS